MGKVICITFILHILTKRLHTEHNEKDRQLNKGGQNLKQAFRKRGNANVLNLISNQGCEI